MEKSQETTFSEPSIKFKGVYAQQIRYVFDMSAEGVTKLFKALTMCELNFDGGDDSDVEAQRFFMEEFYPFVKEVVKGMD